MGSTLLYLVLRLSKNGKWIILLTYPLQLCCCYSWSCGCSCWIGCLSCLCSQEECFKLNNHEGSVQQMQELSPDLRDDIFDFSIFGLVSCRLLLFVVMIFL